MQKVELNIPTLKNFRFIYIINAHPSNIWQKTQNEDKQHKNQKDDDDGPTNEGNSSNES